MVKIFTNIFSSKLYFRILENFKILGINKIVPEYLSYILKMLKMKLEFQFLKLKYFKYIYIIVKLLNVSQKIFVGDRCFYSWEINVE